MKVTSWILLRTKYPVLLDKLAKIKPPQTLPMPEPLFHPVYFVLLIKQIEYRPILGSIPKVNSLARARGLLYTNPTTFLCPQKVTAVSFRVPCGLSGFDLKTDYGVVCLAYITFLVRGIHA
jgi:hypothetical protein